MNSRFLGRFIIIARQHSVVAHAHGLTSRSIPQQTSLRLQNAETPACGRWSQTETTIRVANPTLLHNTGYQPPCANRAHTSPETVASFGHHWSSLFGSVWFGLL